MQVEWIVLADAAQAVGNKAYILGGGWDQLQVPGPGHPHHCAIAVSLLVPWNETNEPHTVAVEMMSADGTDRVRLSEGRLEVGRPVGVARGQDQRAIIAIDLAVGFQRSGRFELRALPDGEDEGARSVAFTVNVQAPQAAAGAA